MLKRFLFILLILALPSWAGGANYFVAPTAVGSGDGSTAGNAGTITTILNGVDFANGDVVVLKAEVTYATTITLAATVAGNGVTGLTIRGSQAADGDWGDGAKDEDTSKPLFDANTAKPLNINGTTAYKIASLTIQDIAVKGQGWLATKDAAVDFEYINGLVVNGLDYNGHTDWSGTTTGKNLLNIQASKGAIEVTGCTIQNAGPTSVATTGPGPNYGTTTYSDYVGIAIQFVTVAGTTIAIHGNTLHNFNSDAILYYRSTATTSIYENTAYNCGENFVDVKGSDNVTIYKNKAYRESTFTGTIPSSEGSLVHIHDFQSTNQSENVIVRDNYFYDNPDYEGVKIFTAEDAALTRNVKVYRNKFQNVGTAVFIRNVSAVDVYDNIILDPPTDGIGFYVRHTTAYGAPPDGYGARIHNNTFAATGQIGAGVSAWRSPDGYFIFKNNVFVTTYDGTAYLVNSEDADKPTFIDNIFANLQAGNQDIIEWNGTAYDESEIAGWEADAEVNSNAFSDPGLADITNDQLWAASAASAIINTGTDVSSEISDSANGLSQEAAWNLGSTTSDVTVPRLDNGGFDRGAYEFSEEEAPAPVGGAAPTGTYLVAWNGDYTDDVSMAWDDAGSGTHDGTVSAGVEITGDYGVTGNGARFSVADEYIEWEDTAGDTTNPSEYTVWLTLTAEGLAGNTEFFRILQDATNRIYAYFRSTGVISLVHHGNNVATTLNSTDIISVNTPVLIGLRGSVSNNKVSIKVGAGDWLDDSDDDAVTAFAAGTRYVTIGESVRGTGIGVASPFTIDNFSIDDTYNQTAPDWTPADVTAPTVTALGVCSDASCTACTADLTAAYGLSDSFRVCGAVSEDVIVTESPTWTFTCGTQTITLSYFQKVDISGTKYLTAMATIPAKARCTDPELIEMTNYSGIVDGSENVVDPTGSAGVFSTGTITIAAEGSWSIGTFTDEESNTYQGEYATPAAAAAAGYNPVQDDVITLGSFTGDLNTWAAGTSGHPITWMGTSAASKAVVTGALTFDEDYNVAYYLDVTGGMKVTGTGVVIYDSVIDGGLSGGKVERCKLTP